MLTLLNLTRDRTEAQISLSKLAFAKGCCEYANIGVKWRVCECVRAYVGVFVCACAFAFKQVCLFAHTICRHVQS